MNPGDAIAAFGLILAVLPAISFLLSLLRKK